MVEGERQKMGSASRNDAVTVVKDSRLEEKKSMAPSSEGKL